MGPEGPFGLIAAGPDGPAGPLGPEGLVAGAVAFGVDAELEDPVPGVAGAVLFACGGLPGAPSSFFSGCAFAAAFAAAFAFLFAANHFAP